MWKTLGEGRENTKEPHFALFIMQQQKQILKEKPGCLESLSSACFPLMLYLTGHNPVEKITAKDGNEQELHH